MSALTIRLHEQHQAAKGRPVRRRLTLREQATKARQRGARLLAEAAEELAIAAELDEAADVCGEAK